jgi:hypothetical protein
MKRLQNQVIDHWKSKGLDLTDTSKMHRMAEEAVNKLIATEPSYQLSWWVTILIVAISTIVSWTLIYLAVNPQFE